MKYTIVSVTDKREQSKSAIRAQLSEHEEITEIEFFGPGHDLLAEAERRGLTFDSWTPRIGELGVWLSQHNCWQWCADNDEPLLVVEDDAIISDGFDEWYTTITENMTTPDALALFVPHDQFNDFEYDTVGWTLSGVWRGGSPNHTINHEFLARAYQGYSCVAILYWPSGARKLLAAVQQQGITTPVDCWLFEQGFPDHRRTPNSERVHIWAPKPRFATGVFVDWFAPTNIHNTGPVC